jgi:hypothetical protein
MSWKKPRKVCPVGDCCEPVRVDFVMCKAHWRLVEPKLKRENQARYRAWLKDRRNVDAIRALRIANAACIASAIGKERDKRS